MRVLFVHAAWQSNHASRSTSALHCANAATCAAVVPEILEPSLQLSAAILGSLGQNSEEINEIISGFRRNHMSELRQLTELSGGSLGYGLSDKSGGGVPGGDKGAGGGGSGAAADRIPKEGGVDAKGMAVMDANLEGVICVGQDEVPSAAGAGAAA